ncbi:MAG TPA: TldD/PmbA family protein [Chloroflexota bacterium]|nr:TldD/PmbA family protein [Chloroflexota bacterium]HZU07694.1 TldD/PmbA family protein [Chloroflexota bacterium]
MLGRDQVQRLLEAALRRSPAEQTEIVLMASDSALTRFANSEIHQNVYESNAEVRVRAVVGKRTGVAVSNRLEPDAIARAVETATALARLQPEDPTFPGLPGPQAIEPVQAYSETTATYSPEQRARAVKVVCDLASEQGLVASGAFSTGPSELAVANSLGLFAYDVMTRAHFTTVIMGEDSSGYAERAAVDVTAIDVEALAREAVDKAVRSRHPVEAPPGEYRVVLQPYAVEEMLSYLAYMGLGALAVQEGRSFLNGRFGQQLVAPSVNLWDDGRDPRGLPMAFDFEGMPKQRVVFFEHGVARGVVYDRRTAAREGRESTGHALPAPNPLGPLPTNLFLGPGDASDEDLLAGIDRGIWITRFWYVNVVHPTRTILTGMTRDGTFLIERGELARPIRNLRFTTSVLDALASVERIGREPLLLGGGLGGSLVPALRVGRFTFTGVTEF